MRKNPRFLALRFVCAVANIVVGSGRLYASDNNAWDELKVKREEVFEFSEKPSATRAGDAVTITFTTKGFCDATVAIECPDGNIIRHLVSGVLGSNAPEPFQKNSKKQTLTWDGKDDQGIYVDDKDAVSIRVSLGLKPQFERTLFWEPKRRIGYQPPILVATEEGVYVYQGRATDSVLLYNHNGDYVRTVYPPAADKVGKMAGLDYCEIPPEGKKFPAKHGWYQATLLTSGLNARMESDLRLERAATAMAVQGDRIGLAFEFLNRLSTDGTTGGLSLQGPKVGYEGTLVATQATENTVLGPSSACLSPDGKRLYLTAYLWRQGYS